MLRIDTKDGLSAFITYFGYLCVLVAPDFWKVLFVISEFGHFELNSASVKHMRYAQTIADHVITQFEMYSYFTQKELRYFCHVLENCLSSGYIENG